MDKSEFLKWSIEAAKWGAKYRQEVGQMPVRSPLRVGEVEAQIDAVPPEGAHTMEEIFADFERIVVPGMTHWQHPGFLAYFPANAAPASVIAEYLTAAMGAQCMLWQTSPAATELEGVMVDWLRQAVGLPEGFRGVIQDSASSATLVAALTMRERALGFRGNAEGLGGQGRLRVYASQMVHSSIERAIWVSGIGANNLVRVPTKGGREGIDPEALEAKIREDLARGYLPAGVMTTVGGTSFGASDPVGQVCEVARRHGVFVHLDAAWAGSAMICEEYRHWWEGVERVDSLVFNPHKWLGAQFDCSAHFVRDPDDLANTMAIRPEYLKTYGEQEVTNYSEWSISLGRRFRALKVWFLIRAYGLEGLRQMIRNHVAWASEVAKKVEDHAEFELMTPCMLSLLTFRHTPQGVGDLDAHNLALLQAINDDGRVYLTQTKVEGAVVLRFQVGQFEVTRPDVLGAWEVVCELASKLRCEEGGL